MEQLAVIVGAPGNIEDAIRFIDSLVDSWLANLPLKAQQTITLASDFE